MRELTSDTPPVTMETLRHWSAALQTSRYSLVGHIMHTEKDVVIAYVFPNDLSEQDRLDYQNVIITRKMLGGRLHFAPFSTKSPPRRVLDVATGTGDWVILMGDQYPTAYVEGIDLSPIQPRLVPPNVRFYVQDASEPWGYSQPFDYIHTRSTLGSFKDFKNEVIKQAFDTLEPGGWFESLDPMATWYSDDGTLNPNGALLRWNRDVNEASEIIGRPLSIAHNLKRWYEEVGFVDVHEEVFKMPTNGWPEDPNWKEMGKLWEQNLLEGLSAFSLGLLSKAFERTADEILLSLVDVRREIQDTSIHSYQPIYLVWGQKPLFPKEATASGVL